MFTLDNEKLLIARARSGEVKAFEILYRLHVDRVFGLCRKLLSKSHEAEDACQEVFIKAWRKLDSFGGESNFSTWLYRITSNECVDRMRRRSNWHEELEMMPYDQEDLNERSVVLESRLSLDQALAKLSDKSRAVVLLREYLGYSHEEIAQVSGIATSTSRAHFHSAKIKLRALL